MCLYVSWALMFCKQGGRYEIPKDRLESAVEEIMNPETKEGTGMFQVNYQKLADHAKACREAKQLFEAGEDRWGTDEETFIRIFATRDYYQMRETWNEYVKVRKFVFVFFLYFCIVKQKVFMSFLLLSYCYHIPSFSLSLSLFLSLSVCLSTFHNACYTICSPILMKQKLTE